MTKVHAILACTDDHVVGKEDYIPWKMSTDMKRFKELTTGHVLLMGYRTFAGILKHYPRPTIFPGRKVVVVADYTRDGKVGLLLKMEDLARQGGVDLSNVTVANSFQYKAIAPEDMDRSMRDRLLDFIDDYVKPKADQIVYIAGGASIYQDFMPAVDTVEVTVVETFMKKQPKGAFNYDLSNSKLVELTPSIKKELFSMNSPFKRELIGKISKYEKNEYNASYYQLTRSLDGSTPAKVLQGSRS